ncbi:hypothetical protein, partial [Giesbergeria sinuosa]
MLIPKLSKSEFFCRWRSKVDFAFGLLVSVLWFRSGTGAGSFFRLCCWLWVAAVWASVLTRRSSGQLSAAAYLSSLDLTKRDLMSLQGKTDDEIRAM